MVEVLIEEMFGSDRSRPEDYRRAVVIDARETSTANERTPRSERGRVCKNNLTEPTLLEMSGYPCRRWDRRRPHAITAGTLCDNVD
jgi:hypothetical protein